MTIVNILIGLVGLGVVVFIHELGHLLAAKAVGIEVEAFSLGWGRKLIGRTWRGTEYRLSVFPIGGYCKMKGEQGYIRALENDQKAIPRDPGSVFAAKPWARVVTFVAGPAMNFLFAVIVMAIIHGFGFSIQTFDNRVVLAADYPEISGVSEEPSAAERAGVQTGDEVVSMAGREVQSYADLQQIVAQNAQDTIQVTLRRDGRLIETSMTPDLNRDSGAGVMGVYAYVEPVIGQLNPSSIAAAAGLQSGDRVVAVNGEPIDHSIELLALLASQGSSTLLVNRDDAELEISIPAPSADSPLGLAFQPITVRTPRLGPFAAIARGAQQSVQTLVEAVRSLRLLFRGVNLTQAVAGPIRISHMIGDVATSGFSFGFGAGVRSVFSFLALLSVVLFFMNLLPIPVLDGGQIVLVAIEAIRGRPARPKTIYRYQLIGMVLIFGLLIFAVFGDILFLANGA